MTLPPFSLSVAWATIKRFAVLIVVGVALLAVAWSQVRISGFGFDLPLIGRVGITGWAEKVDQRDEKIDRLEGEIQSIVIAQDQAAAAQKAVNDTSEAIFNHVTGRVDEYVQIQNGAARAASNQLIADFSVRCPTTGSSPFDALAPATDQGTGDAQGASAVPELAGVLVPERDILICEENTLKAIAGHRFATEIEAASNRDSTQSTGEQ